MQPAHSATLTAGLGLEGDSNAHRLSPRQILVTLASELEALSIAPGALRENLVVAVDEDDEAAAHFVPGSAITGAGGIEIRLTMYCEPCKQIAPLVGNLAAVLERRGILGVIAGGGQLSVGEALTITPKRYPALPESPYQRFLDFVATIPPGRVVRYRDVALAIGVDNSFMRAIPGYIRRSLARGLPLHRIVNARGQLLDAVPNQAARLAAEGVRSDGMPPHVAIDLARLLWQGQ